MASNQSTAEELLKAIYREPVKLELEGEEGDLRLSLRNRAYLFALSGYSDIEEAAADLLESITATFNSVDPLPLVRTTRAKLRFH